MNVKIETGWPNNIMVILKRKVRYIVDKVEVKEFYIGRTNDLKATLNRHRCNEIVPIYQSDSIPNICVVEDELINTFISYSKCSNDADNSKGNISEEYVNYVYVAIW